MSGTVPVLGKRLIVLMEYTIPVKLVIKTIQQAKAAPDSEPRFTYALYALLQLSPAESLIARALQEDSVWEPFMRRQFVQYMSNPEQNRHLRPSHDAASPVFISSDDVDSDAW